jgi:small-conductance mechanosensitive channel
MQSRAGRLTGVLTLAALLLAPTAASAALKCWTNADGVRECGATIPPEYVGQGHEQVNSLGVKVGEEARARTAEEFAAEREAERKAKAEAERLAAERARQIQEDRILLETFASEDDILLARDGKLAAIDIELRFADSTASKLSADLDARIAEAASYEMKGETVPAELEHDIGQVRDQIAAQRRFIEEKTAEKERVRQEHDVLRERFADLRSRRPEAESSGR